MFQASSTLCLFYRLHGIVRIKLNLTTSLNSTRASFEITVLFVYNYINVKFHPRFSINEITEKGDLASIKKELAEQKKQLEEQMMEGLFLPM